MLDVTAASNTVALDKDVAYIQLLHHSAASVASWVASWAASAKQGAGRIPSYLEEAAEASLLLLEDLESCTKV